MNGQKPFGITIKISDGNFRALDPVAISLLKRFHILSEEQIGAVKKYDPTVVRNHRKKDVGFIQSVI
jgi:L-asparaginase II